MAKNIDWMYDRKACATCKKARGFMEQVACTVLDRIDATKVKKGPAEALELLKDVETLIAVKGKKIYRFNLKSERPDDETLLSHLIGPTGNLRAPTARIGSILLVGFDEATYQEVLSG